MILHGERVDRRLPQSLDLLLAPDAGELTPDDGEEGDERQHGEAEREPAEPGRDRDRGRR